MRKLNQAGDTIIEVLIAIGVIGVVLSAGFVLTNSSLTSERNSQERNIALNILQSQIEGLRSLTTPPTGSTANDFCVINKTPVYLYGGPGGGVTPQCEFNIAGSNGNSSNQPQYVIDICYFNSSAGPHHDTYWVRIRWVPLGGGSQDQINAYYRLYY